MEAEITWATLDLFDSNRDTALPGSLTNVEDFFDRRLEVFSSSHILGESRASLQVAELLAVVPTNPYHIMIYGVIGLGIQENFSVHAAWSDDAASIRVLVKNAVDLRAELLAAVPRRNWRKSRGGFTDLVGCERYDDEKDDPARWNLMLPPNQLVRSELNTSERNLPQKHLYLGSESPRSNSCCLSSEKNQNREGFWARNRDGSLEYSTCAVTRLIRHVVLDWSA
jgi:hypothetical protein